MANTEILDDYLAESSVVAPAHPGGGYAEADPRPKKAVLADYLTEAELARELDKSKRTLERWRRLRIGPTPTICGNKILYAITDVRIWLRAQRRPAA